MGYVAQMGEKRNAHTFLVGNPERDHLGDLGIDGSI